MSYLSEFRSNWRGLTAAGIGLAVGYTFINYVTNIFSPYLIRDLGWAKSDFALLGLVVIVAAICQPLAGRLTDAIGVRRVAAIGVVSGPVLFLLLSQLSGPFWQFYVINVLQVILVGGTTSAVVYTRLIAEKFNVARGVALGVAACAPAIAGLIGAPFLSVLVENYGWRSGYIVVAGFVAVVGLVALALIPRDSSLVRMETSPRVRGAVDYRQILRDPAFQLIMAGMLLCNLTLTLQMTQVKIVLLDVGLNAAVASAMISLYAAGVIAGRLACGLALDRYPASIVSALTMAAPAIGLLMLASGASTPLLAGIAVAILGLATGAEGDVGAYLVMRYFPREIYGSVFGLVMSALSLSGAIGALLLSFTLALTGKFTMFLVISAVAAIVGGALFLLLGARSVRRNASEPLTAL